ncbi:MAG: ADP-ribosylglycohydrolase family protein [Spirochaetota bacterium]
MSTLTMHDRRRAAVLGALVADAASLGLHWIYTQPKIRRAAPQTPEFVDPDPGNYEGVPAFFAHPHKHAGDSTMYGEYVALLLRSMTGTGGEYDEGSYLSHFQNYFGAGGEYVGYADGPMRETLYNAITLTKEIEQHALGLDLPEVSDEIRKMIAHYVSRYFLEYDTEGLKRVVREAVGMHDGVTESDLEACAAVVDHVQKLRRPTGPDDAQMPALTKSAVLLARYGGSGAELPDELTTALENAVRMTNNNDLAVAYATGLARMLQRITSEEELAALGDPGPDTAANRDRLAEIARKSFSHLPSERRADVEKALGMLGEDTKAITLKFGPACDCAMGVPSGLHNVATSASYTEAVRKNIYACGDSCGRAMIVGAIMGALYGIGGERGIPEAWVAKTRIAEDVQRLLDALVG